MWIATTETKSTINNYIILLRTTRRLSWFDEAYLVDLCTFLLIFGPRDGYGWKKRSIIWWIRRILSLMSTCVCIYHECAWYSSQIQVGRYTWSHWNWVKSRTFVIHALLPGQHLERSKHRFFQAREHLLNRLTTCDKLLYFKVKIGYVQSCCSHV